MTDADLRLPGQGRPRTKGSPKPTTSARSWAELIETIQGGLAVLDKESRLTFVSDRFLTALGEPNNLVGQDLRDLLPGLADEDPRALQAQFQQGNRVEFEQQFQTTDGAHYWYRVTLVPCNSLGEGVTAVVFAKDITETSRTLAQLRDATVGLTEVESELHRRVGRDVHDGPIQLLAALVLQLGLSNTDEAHELQRTVSDVAITLRRVIEEFSPEFRGVQETLLERWLAPLLVDSEMEMNVQDRRSAESGLAEVQAVFVLIYQAIGGVRDPTFRRTFNVELADERGGERIVFTSPSTQPATLSGSRATRFRSSTHHVRALGGTLSTWLDDNDVRTISMWIPKLTQPVKPSTDSATGSVQTSQVRTARDVSPLPPLTDSTWRKIVTDAPERMIEFDDQMRISFANTAQQEAIGVYNDQLIGLSAEELFATESLSQLIDVFDRLDGGEFVETDWYRKNFLGDERLIHLTVSPRLDEAGQWLGLFLATEDRTDVELLDDLYQTALSDLTLARRRAIDASIQRLQEPLADCEKLIDQLERFESVTPHPEPVRNIIIELEVALDKIKDSASVFGAPQHSIRDLEVGLRNSLGTLLAGRQLTVADNTTTPPPPDISDVFYRITREAVGNAVLHGRADFISVTLANTKGGISCEIHDTGVGVDTDRLRHRPGHLGVRLMRERARERGGTCCIERHPLVGTLVSIWLPDAAPVTGG